MKIICYDDQMYDDKDDEEDDDEGEIGLGTEMARRESAEIARGQEDRAFSDGLAKQEDDRHNAMRKDIAKRALVVGELQQKLRHKQAELRILEQSVVAEQDIIDYETKKSYRMDAHTREETPLLDSVEPIPILTRDIPQKDNTEFSIERAEAHVKQLISQKDDMAKVLGDMTSHLNEEERALSQLNHKIMRM